MGFDSVVMFYGGILLCRVCVACKQVQSRSARRYFFKTIVDKEIFLESILYTVTNNIIENFINHLHYSRYKIFSI